MSNEPGSRWGTVTVVLSCLHTVEFARPLPVIGDHVYCFRCAAYKRAGMAPEVFTVKCLDCRGHTRRLFPRSPIAADIAADRHARKRPGHRVYVMNGETVFSERAHDTLTLSDTPPF